MSTDTRTPKQIAADKLDELRAERDHFRDFAKEATAKMTNYAGGGSELFHGERFGMFLADVDVCIDRFRRRFQTQQSALVRAVKQREEANAYGDAEHARAEAAEAALAAMTAEREEIGRRWAMVGHHDGIEVSVQPDAAGTWNALCALLDPLARAFLAKDTERQQEGLENG